MTATLPPLPSELLSSFSVWRQPIHDVPLTPPLTSTFKARKMHSRMQQVPTPTTILPPITYFDRHLPPLTPPRLEVSCSFQNSSPSSPMLQTPGPSSHFPLQAPQLAVTSDPFAAHLSEQQYPVVDWLDFSRKRSAHFIAEKTCEMICYLWFSSPSSNVSLDSKLQPYSTRLQFATTSLQLHATPTFIYFMQKLLETTQVSQSVIVLSLHYIYRLKERNRYTTGQPGSEFRIAVAGLMMANKFLDDNTYTNKTWSEVSGIELEEINRMEREFLIGIDFGLYVDKATYESWLNLLKGLVWAKDMDSRRWRRSRGPARVPRLLHPQPSGLTTRTHTRHQPYRARSTSPGLSKLATPPYHNGDSSSIPPANAVAVFPTLRLGSKRPATAAFSPTTATFAPVPAKRPVSMSLVIPESLYFSGTDTNSNTHSPLEPLQSFAKLSIGSSPAGPPSSRLVPSSSVLVPPTQETAPATLVTAYSVDEWRRNVPPQNLYFYSLACSPMGKEEDSRWRKAKLRYHQPPPATSTYFPIRPPIPVDVQSASASPHDVHMSLPLPHFHDTDWSQQPQLTNKASPFAGYSNPPQQVLPPCMECSVPSAPFANAGPPGVQFYGPVHRATSHEYSRGRAFQ